ncbi:MAG: hypothetical protein JW889_09205 [Verrucomicrobia bacterium]|nr:hypothetical protein [Verrucomicrobiota bacterium]
MLDERSASWKLLVPTRRRERLLAVGLDAGGTASLARWWQEVAWVPPSPEAARMLESPTCDSGEHLPRVRTITRVGGNGTGYDTIVVGAWPNGDLLNPALIASLLTPDGALVSLGFAGSRLTTSGLKRLGFQSVRRYAALPSDRPRLYFSTASRAVRAKGLGFHAPGSRQARWLVRAAQRFSALGLRQHLHRGAVLVASRDDDAHVRDDLAVWLSQQLDLPLRDLVIYAGSDSPARKLTVLATADNGDADVVAKLADTQTGVAALRREATALAALGGTPAASCAPAVLLEGTWCDCTVHVQSCVPSNALRQKPKLNDALVWFLVHLSHIGRVTMAAEKTAAWQRIEQHLLNTNGDNVPPAVARLTRQLTRLEEAERRVVCHRTHGDFTPWNIKWCDDQPFVIDWEESEPAGLELSDACRFLFRQASLVGPWPGGHAMLRRLRTTCNESARRAGLPIAGIGTALRLWMLDEYLAQPSAHILDLLDAATGGKPWRVA